MPGSDLEVRDVRHRDLERVLEIEREAFTTPWPASAFALAVAAPDVLFLGVYARLQLVGYVVVAPTAGDAVLIANLAVAAQAQRSGVASALIEAVLDWAAIRGAASCRLDVRRSNEPAIALYRRFGFRNDGVQRNYYNFPREDALSMVRPLVGGNTAQVDRG